MRATRRSLRFRFLLALAAVVYVASTAAADSSTDENNNNNDEATVRRAIRMKTTGQLKKIFAELDIAFSSSLSKKELQDLAFDSSAMTKWWDLHPDKRPKPKKNSGGDSSNIDEDWLKRQMMGDFSHVEDPEKRRILESLKAKGLNMAMAGGSNDMPLEKLVEMEKMLGNINMGGGANGDDL